MDAAPSFGVSMDILLIAFLSSVDFSAKPKIDLLQTVQIFLTKAVTELRETKNFMSH